MKIISILGSTGSIGRSTLDVIRSNKDDFEVFALSCNKNTKLIIKQAIEFKPKFVFCSNEDSAKKLKTNLPARLKTKVLFSSNANSFIASHESVTHVVAAISGSAGLDSTFAAVKSKKVILLANKESLVMAGPLIMEHIKKDGGNIIPIDSEHNAIYQVLQGASNKKKFLKRLILTASGGPFLKKPLNKLSQVTLVDALNHPNWKMGHKVTIDSATMMNKGLEVIEAFYLFNISLKNIDVVIHPESLIHSLVEFIDGSILAQMGKPDMRIPISYALGYPNRINSGASFLDLKDKNLHFINPDLKKFPCLSLAFKSLEKGHAYCVALNASNEIAVEAFLNKKIKFTDIYKIINKTLNKTENCKLNTLSDIKDFDFEIKEKAQEIISNIF